MLGLQCFPQHLEKQNGNQYFPISRTNINDGAPEIQVSLLDGGSSFVPI